MSDAPLLYSYPDARKKLGNIGRNTLHNLINEGMLARVHIGRRGFITAASLEAYVAMLEKQSKKNGQGKKP